MEDISPLKRFIKITRKDTRSANSIVKKFHLKHPKGIILYQDEAESLLAYKNLIAYQSFIRGENHLLKQDEENISLISLKLSTLINKKYSISEISEVYKNHKEQLFPEMIVRIHGNILSFKNKKYITLNYEGSTLTVAINNTANLFSEKKFLLNRFVFIIGKIVSLEKELKIMGVVILT